MRKTGIFITFEGPDGAGKTTQALKLKEYFIQRGIDCLFTREPGGTSIGDKIRDILLDNENKKMCAKTEVFLYAAARAQLVTQVILPALEQGKVVICDRYIDSSFAYQSFGLGEETDFVLTVNEEATQGLYPDLTLLLDVAPEEGLRRQRERYSKGSKAQDRIEMKELEFHQKVRQGYLFLAKIQKERVLLLEAGVGEQEVHKEVIKAVEDLFLVRDVQV
ncbi:dTMP kinase [Candidatus Contubernalis alkaliaceticus]|uniref:dTMP kinase n=1 Tax=Candidatus Contubernalis alkaliaceticus TaxID=338645 RepID=UPI001F4C2728|nr:dTMP kinase [Candidatus Contubernalis alkalaceticus]UNC90674.1 dTMP kinase [Candidatus Contubernalis alkalaceticus]